MKIIKTMVILLIFSLVYFLVGCSSYFSSRIPNIGIRDEELNKDIVFYQKTAKRTYKSTDYISINFLVNSNNTIRLKKDYDLRLFYLMNGNWVEFTPYSEIPGLYEKENYFVETDQPDTDYPDTYRIQTINNEEYFIIYPNDSMIMKQRSILLPPLANFIGPIETEIIQFIQADRIAPNTNDVTKIGAFIQYKIIK